MPESPIAGRRSAFALPLPAGVAIGRAGGVMLIAAGVLMLVIR